LPHGLWYDFWTEEKIEGGREIVRAVDLETMPLYVRAGGIIPSGAVRQYTSEKIDAPMTLQIYPGADGRFLFYEDDGSSFNYRDGEWMGVQLTWNDRRRLLGLRLAQASRMLTPQKREIEVRLATAKTIRRAVFAGRPLEVKF